MITIYILFQLIAGQVTEVDAFMGAVQCDEAKAQLTEMVARARAQRPELPALVTFCKAVTVTPTNA